MNAKNLKIISDIIYRHGASYLKDNGICPIYLYKGESTTPKPKIDLFFLRRKQEGADNTIKNCVLMLSLFGNTVVCLVDQFDAFKLDPVILEINESIGKIKEIESILKIGD